MLGGRRTTPLFDLLTKHEPAATPAAPVRNPPPVPEIMPAKPVLRIELKPREIQRTEAPAPVPEPEVTPEPTVRVHANAVYVTVAVVLTLLVLAIAIGWQMGKSRQAQNDEQFMRRPAPTLAEPGSEPAELSRVSAPGPGPAAAPQASGPADPREKGLNYLYLAVLTQAEAERAGKFLRDNGVEAYAVAMVDPSGGKANNADPLYRLFVKPGIPSGELKKTTAQNLQTRVLELGSRWQKESRGTSNFAKYSWEKFQ
jgi:hypothetical protein